MTGYFLSGPGRYIDVAALIVGAKFPHHSEVRTTTRAADSRLYWSELKTQLSLFSRHADLQTCRPANQEGEEGQYSVLTSV